MASLWHLRPLRSQLRQKVIKFGFYVASRIIYDSIVKQFDAHCTLPLSLHLLLFTFLAPLPLANDIYVEFQFNSSTNFPGTRQFFPFNCFSCVARKYWEAWASCQNKNARSSGKNALQEKQICTAEHSRRVGGGSELESERARAATGACFAFLATLDTLLVLFFFFLYFSQADADIPSPTHVREPPPRHTHSLHPRCSCIISKICRCLLPGQAQSEAEEIGNLISFSCPATPQRAHHLPLPLPRYLLNSQRLSLCPLSAVSFSPRTVCAKNLIIETLSELGKVERHNEINPGATKRRSDEAAACSRRVTEEGSENFVSLCCCCCCCKSFREHLHIILLLLVRLRQLQL